MGALPSRAWVARMEPVISRFTSGAQSVKTGRAHSGFVPLPPIETTMPFFLFVTALS